MENPPPSRPRETSPLRMVLILTALTAVALSVIYVRVHSHRSALLTTQQACLDFRAPADQVVYDENPTRAAELFSASPTYSNVPTGDSGEPIAGHIPAAWRSMMAWISPNATLPQDAVLFLHERQTQFDKRGLVCVQADRANRKLRVTFVHPGASTLDPVAISDVRVTPRPLEGLVLLSAGEDPFAVKLPSETIARADLRFLSGQPDPTDPSHWTIPYQFENRAGELEMWIQDERTIHYIDRRFEFSTPVTRPKT